MPGLSGKPRFNAAGKKFSECLADSDYAYGDIDEGWRPMAQCAPARRNAYKAAKKNNMSQSDAAYEAGRALYDCMENDRHDTTEEVVVATDPVADE